MADDPAVQTAASPVSDDVELEDILRRSQVPTVVIRKDSSCAADVAADGDDDATRLHTPAPMASFEVLSDVDESDMDDVTSVEAQTVDSAPAAHVDVELQANGLEPTDVVDNENTSEQYVIDSEMVRDEWRSRDDDEPMRVELAGGAGVPTLVFEDVDANNPTTLSSPECIVNNDDVVQEMWQWTADNDQGNIHYDIPFPIRTPIMSIIHMGKKITNFIT